MNQARLRRFFLVLALVLPLLADAATLTGRVVRVADGDTITVLDSSNRQHKVRFQGIDAPERGQPYGNASRKHLTSLVAREVVTVEWEKRDRYGRIVGKVWHDSIDAGLEQIRAGMAWHYTHYQREQTAADREAYAKAEQEARQRRVGLWVENAIPPWDWRARRNKSNTEAAAGREIP